MIRYMYRYKVSRAHQLTSVRISKKVKQVGGRHTHRRAIRGEKKRKKKKGRRRERGKDGVYIGGV